MRLTIFTVAAFLATVRAHGYLSDPPGRSSLWRYGYKNPANYDDNQLFCGGYQNQWFNFGGKCGLCGDDYAQARPRPNENTGMYGRGIIGKTYKAGSHITVTVQLTANHWGWFQYSICKLDTNTTLEEEECFEENVLQLVDGSGSQYKLPSPNPGPYAVALRLPAGLTCSRCVLRWNYNTGNSWGTCQDGTGAIGCGAQETFRSCADIAIEL